MNQLVKRIPISLKLAGFSMILTIVFGVGFGVLMAVKKTGCWIMFWGHFPRLPCPFRDSGSPSF